MVYCIWGRKGSICRNGEGHMRKRGKTDRGFWQEKRNKIFWFYLLTYLAVLFVPMMIICLYDVNMLLMIAKDERKEKEAELSHAAVLMDNKLDELEYFGEVIATNPYVNEFRKRSIVFDYPNSYRVYELCASLPEMYQIGQSIFDYFIFFDKSEMVIGKSAAYTYEEFYNLYMEDKSFPDYETWYTYMKEDEPSYGLSSVGSYVYKRNQTETEKKLFFYERPLVSSGGLDYSRIRIYMEESAVKEILPVTVEESVQLIQDLDGNILYRGADETEARWKEEKVGELTRILWENRTEDEHRIRVGGESYEVIRYVSGRSELIYYMLLPMRVMNQRMLSNLLLFGGFLLVGSAAGVTLSYYMSSLSATPINDILHSVSETTGHLDGNQSAFKSLKTTFNYLVETNSRLSKAIEMQKPYLRNSFINRLIYGSYATEEEIQRVADNVGFLWENMVFGVVIFRFHLFWDGIREEDAKLMNACILSLMEGIREILPGSLYTNMGEEEVVLLLALPAQDKENFQTAAERYVVKIKDRLSPDISEKLFVYGGSVAERLGEVTESYQNASCMILDENGCADNTVIWCRTPFMDMPEYPSQSMTTKLEHFVTAGDEKGLHDALEEVIRKYIIENNLPVYLQHMLLNELQSVIFRIIGRMGMKEEDYRQYYLQLEENYSMPLIQQITGTLNLYRQVCGYVERQKQQGTAEMLESSVFVAYIDANFGDPNLSLSSVAAEFKISEGHLSKMFKMKYNTRFSAFVETVRMDKAKDFLTDTSLSVSEISELTGYLSVNTFCRAFKRVTGLTPSNYRKKQQ